MYIFDLLDSYFMFLDEKRREDTEGEGDGEREREDKQTQRAIFSV